MLLTKKEFLECGIFFEKSGKISDFNAVINQGVRAITIIISVWPIFF
jgi:hypothetical protein